VETEDEFKSVTHYLMTVSTVGIGLSLILAAWLAVWHGYRVTDDQLIAVVLLGLLGAAACRFPLHVSHNTLFSVQEIPYVAAIVLLPVGLVSVVVLVAGLGFVLNPGDVLQARLFNAGQNMLFVLGGSLIFSQTKDVTWLGPELADLGAIGAIALTFVVMLLLNTGLVAGALTRILGARFNRMWRERLASDVRTFAVLAPLGLVTAVNVRDYPWAVPVLVLPAALLQIAMRRNVDLRDKTTEALSSLVDVVELRDPYTAGHSHRVASLARTIAERLGMTAEEADLVEVAGRVHDLGKVAVDPAILLKFGPLDASEWQEMRRHPGDGAGVIARFAGFDQVAEYVRHHHERWDGGGYPSGLVGDDIPLGARVLSVADAFDALTSARSYRPARGEESALRVLEEGAGSQWDPRVVAALCAHQRSTEPTLAPPVRETSTVPA
jgi:HD-GYP domain-containing protein (c-di-GMP phosphodiesterase class II)